MRIGWRRLRRGNPNDRDDFRDYISASEVVIGPEQPDDIGALAKSKNWVETAPNPAVRTWTDDYSNIAGAFLRKHLK
jgi:hypothetical protein